MKLKYLVVGTGRSGTGFMSKLLTMNGIKCGHEKVLKLKIDDVDYKKLIDASTEYEAESHWGVVPHLDEIKGLFPHLRIIQITRDPIKVIRSFIQLRQNITGANRAFVPYMPFVDTDDQFDVLSQYYISWYHYIEKHSEITLDIDNFDYDLLSSYLGRQEPLKQLDEIVNTKPDMKQVDITYEEVHHGVRASYKYFELKALAAEYGFDI